MKEIFLQYAAYTTWANGLLLNAVQMLGEDQQKAELRSSFTSLYKTFLHLLDAESIWWQRMKLQEKIERPSDSFSGNMQALGDRLLQQNRLWQDWVNNASEAALQHEFIYFNSKKERFKQPVYQVLLHLFNHSTYHRGQIVTMCRGLGVEKLPPTDFILWARKR